VSDEVCSPSRVVSAGHLGPSLLSKRLVVPWHLLEATHVNFFTPETLRKTRRRFASSCEVVRLGHFFDVDGEPLHIHAAAAAYI